MDKAVWVLCVCACVQKAALEVPVDPADPDGDRGPAVLALPTIAGAADEGSMLSSSLGSFRDAASIEAQWQRCTSNTCEDVRAAVEGDGYTLTQADVGHTMRVRISATNADGTTIVNSEPSDVVRAASAPVNLAAPLISGQHVFTTLTASEGAWQSVRPLTFTYQWALCRATCESIAGAMTPQYVATARDLGARLQVQVTATSTAGSASASAQSAPLSCGVLTQAGPAYPSAVSGIVSDVAWAGTGNVSAADEVVATAGPLAPGFFTQDLVVRNFGLTLPTGSVVSGVEVRVTRHASVADAVKDNAVTLTWGTDKRTKVGSAVWSTNSSTEVFGGPSDAWGGAPLVAADVSNVSIRLSANNTSEAEATANVDAIELIVHYQHYVAIGPLSPSVVTSTGMVAWLNPANAQTAVADAATANLTPANGQSGLLSASGFTAALPGGAAVSGLLVEVAQAPTGNAPAHYSLMTNGGAVKTLHSTQVRYVNGYAQFGGPNDMWDQPTMAAAPFSVSYAVTTLGLTADTAFTVAHLRATFFHSPTAQSASGFPSLAASESISDGWANVANSRQLDGSAASATVHLHHPSHMLLFGGFGVSLPSGAALSGVTVAVTRNTNGIDALNNLGAKDVRVALVENRSSPAPWGTSPETVTYGSTSDTWGLSAADLTTAQLSLVVTQDVAPASLGAYVDAVALTAHYCMPQSTLR